MKGLIFHAASRNSFTCNCDLLKYHIKETSDWSTCFEVFFLCGYQHNLKSESFLKSVILEIPKMILIISICLHSMTHTQNTTKTTMSSCFGNLWLFALKKEELGIKLKLIPFSFSTSFSPVCGSSTMYIYSSSFEFELEKILRFLLKLFALGMTVLEYVVPCFTKETTLWILSHYSSFLLLTHAVCVQNSTKVHKVSEDIFGNYSDRQSWCAVA